jgi:plastocyanin
MAAANDWIPAYQRRVSQLKMQIEMLRHHRSHHHYWWWVGRLFNRLTDEERNLAVLELIPGDRTRQAQAMRWLRWIRRSDLALGRMRNRGVNPRWQWHMDRWEAWRAKAQAGLQEVLDRPALPVLRREAIRDEEAFEQFACDVIDLSPATPDRVEPDREFFIEFFGNLDIVPIRMPDGRDVRFWGFRPADGEANFPSDTIRVVEGEVIHGNLHVRKNVHTIHWHGIEPTSFNDGVGHTSFEVQSRYTYQWFASTAGTYFYHCHVNTTLHFEMGMYGFLIIDPPPPPRAARAGGAVHDGRTRRRPPRRRRRPVPGRGLVGRRRDRQRLARVHPPHRHQVPV